ncbi:MAG: hypothetical protein K0Q95_209 [Bacteroidota bacterium]|jgi:hypothetical protein|nr:hypothetical protein [Bacteroidota bacterium]
MKKFLVAAIVLVAMSFQAVAGPIVTIKFEVGRKSLGCTKFGICNIGLDVNYKISTVQINDQTGDLELAFTKEAIVGKEDFFTGTTVTFEEAFTMSPEVQKALGSRSAVTIGIGTYKLVKTRSGYQITIPQGSMLAK